MDTDDLTVHILREIRDEIRGTNTRLDTTIARLDSLETRVNDGFAAADSRAVGVESSITALHRDLVRIRPIGDGDVLVKRVSRCERDIAELKQRLDEPRR